MKRFCFLLLAASFLLLSCEKEDPSIALSVGLIDAPADGVQQTVTLTCNRSWTASCSDPWLTVTPASGTKGETALTIQVAPNSGTSVRKGSVNFSCAEITRSVTVNQIQPFKQSLIIVHNLDVFHAPDMRGNDLSAEVDWGDGNTTPWRSGMEHGYSSAGNHKVAIKIAGATWFQQTDVTGISEIDLSGF